MNFFSSILALGSLTFILSAPVGANETFKVDREYATARAVELAVTPSGVAIDFNSVINAVNLVHLGEIVFNGLDGVLCQSTVDCPEEAIPPTMLLLRKIPPIDFPDQQSNSDGTTMLYVNTEDGLYRFELEPQNQKPRYTKVEIVSDPLPPLFPNSYQKLNEESR